VFHLEESYGRVRGEDAVTQPICVAIRQDPARIDDLWWPRMRRAEARYYKYQDEKFETLVRTV